MLISSTAATDAIEGHANTSAYRINIELPDTAEQYSDCSLSAESISISSNVTTDVPPGSRLQPGYSARQATIVLNGQVDARDSSKTAAWLFGQYSTTSPLYRGYRLFLPVTIDFGVYVPGSTEPEWFRRFTGRIDGIVVQPTTGAVSIRCIDRRNDMRSQITIPAVNTAPPLNTGLTSEFAVDAILRAALTSGASTWPAARSRCVLAAGMRASVWPQVGTITSVTFPDPSVSEPDFAPGVYGSGLSAGDPLGNVIEYLTSSVVMDSTHQDLTIEMFAVGFDEFTDISMFFSNAVSGGSTIGVFYGNAGFGVTWVTDPDVVGDSYGWSDITIDGGPHYIGVHFHWEPGLITLELRLDGTTIRSSGPIATASDPGLFSKNLELTVKATDFTFAGRNTPTAVVISGLQVTREASPAWNDAFIPEATVDPSLNPLQAVPFVSGDPWAALQQICAAELAVGGFDEFGRFSFRNRVTLKGSASVRDLTSKQALADLQIEESASALINHAKADYTPWAFGAAATVWSLSSPTRVPAGRTVTLLASPTDSSLWTGIDTSISKMPNGGGTPGLSYYRASTSKSGLSPHPGISFTVTQLTSSQVRIIIRNNTSIDAWLVSSAVFTDIPVGTPVLHLGGIPITPGSTVTVDAQWPPLQLDGSGGAASDPHNGDVLYQYPSNSWRQDQDAATDLANETVSGGSVVRPNLGTISIAPDPRLQLADRAHLIDDDASGMDEYIQVWGITESMAAGAWTMSIAATAIARPGGWILGVPGRSELGVTTNI